MDIDPLLDAHPPRYAVESDSEDEYGDAPQAIRRPHPSLAIVTLGENQQFPAGRVLVVALGPAGAAWIQGVTLRPSSATLKLGEVSIGSLHSTHDGVFVLQIDHTIPTSACFPVAINVVPSLQPSKVVILDSYAVPSYISENPVAAEDSPIRILRTSHAAKNGSKNVQAQPYLPPNMVQGLSASLLSILEPTITPAYLFLLPTLHIPPPVPQLPTELPDAAALWSGEALVSLHSLIGAALDLQGWAWKPSQTHPPRTGANVRNARADVIGEGGMYM